MFVTIYWVFPFVIRGDGPVTVDSVELLRFAHAAIFCSLLFICSVIDVQRSGD